MKYKQNLHTHTCYCDGADTPEEIVLDAIEKGFDSIGFSAHAFMKYSPSSLKRGDQTESYKKDVIALKEKYNDRIKIYLGLEYELLCEADTNGFDYLIGSVHYLRIGDEYVAFDRKVPEVERVIDTYFGGNGMEYAKAYYRTLAGLPQCGKFDIIGHFDLITKHSDYKEFFDTTSKGYINAAIEAAEALAGKIPFFEVNTGAIARGYRKTPYPSPVFIREFKRLGFGAVITTDCHNKTNLDCKMDEAAELLKSCGYKHHYVLTDGGFVACEL